MVKFPKEILKIIKTLKDAGFETFAVGACVRESLAGQNPYAWDLETAAPLEKLKEFFPDAEVISEKFSIVRMEFIKEVLNEKGEVEGEEGLIVDVATMRRNDSQALVLFSDDMEAGLKQKVFTVDAIADNGYQLLDPTDGREDMKKRLVRTIGPAEERMLADPIYMMKAIRVAAEMDYDLQKDTYEAIAKNYDKLTAVSVERFRDEFVAIMSAPHGGKGLRLLIDTGIINLILTPQVVAHLTSREKNDLMTLCENMDKTMQVPERRLGLFYTCIGKQKAGPSIDKLHFDETTRTHLMDAIKDMPKLYFTLNKPDMKKFIYNRSYERYHYLANLEKAQRIVFGYDIETKIRSRMFLLGEIKQYREPIFVDELAIDAADLLENGIAADQEEAQQLLTWLVEYLHHRPRLNTRKECLKTVKELKKHPLKRWMRNTRMYH